MNDNDFENFDDDIISLAWKKYTKYKDIISNGGKTHFIEGVNSEDIVSKFRDAHIDKFDIRKFEHEFYDIAFKIFSTDGKELGVLFDPQYMIIQTSNNDFNESLELFLSEQLFETWGIVEHGIEKHSISNTLINVSIKSGIIKEDFSHIPYTFMYFRLDKKIIGKALLKYYASEMNDYIPTIQMIEINKGYKKKGHGKKILHFIEKWVLDSGFYRIRAEDLRSYGFWRKMNYDIDIDEGEKELDPFEYE